MLANIPSYIYRMTLRLAQHFIFMERTQTILLSYFSFLALFSQGENTQHYRHYITLHGSTEEEVPGQGGFERPTYVYLAFSPHDKFHQRPTQDAVQKNYSDQHAALTLEFQDETSQSVPCGLLIMSKRDRFLRQCREDCKECLSSAAKCTIWVSTPDLVVL